MANGQIHIIKAQSDSGKISLIYTLYSIVYGVYRPKHTPWNITQCSSSFLICIVFEFVLRRMNGGGWSFSLFHYLIHEIHNDLTCNECEIICDANPTLILILLRVIFLLPILWIISTGYWMKRSHGKVCPNR